MMSTNNDIPRGFKLRHTLRGHESEINRIAWSSDGRWIASSSFDETVRIWDAQTGQPVETLKGPGRAVFCVAWSPDDRLLAFGGVDRSVSLWEVQTKQWGRSLSGPRGNINDLAWSPDGGLLVSGSADSTIYLWQLSLSRSFGKLEDHSNEVYALAWSPNGNTLASGSISGVIRTWDMQKPTRFTKGVSLRSSALSDTSNAIHSLDWKPASTILAAGSRDGTVRLWDIDTGQCVSAFEGHTGPITSVSFSYNGGLLATKSLDGTVRIRLSTSGETVALLAEPASNGAFAGMAFHPYEPVLATLGEKDEVIRIWDLNIPVLLMAAPTISSVHYRNAKVVLVGDSGVGKSGLALVLSGQPYASTDSTHGRYIWDFDSHEQFLSDGRIETRETMLWDLAGQPAYRLIHQLYLSEVAVALVVFDSHSSTDPFAGISYWVRALRMAQQAQGNTAFPIKKLLVAARIDRGTVKVSRERIETLMKKWGFDGYFETSALAGTGISSLTEAIKQIIDWNHLPMVTSTDVFQHIKTFLATRKEEGLLLSTSDALYREYLASQSTTGEREDARAEFETCIGLVEAQGLIRRLSFGGLVLLQPELLDAYASALINAARAEPDELGSISEEEAKSGSFFSSESERIADRDLEKLLLIAMIEDLLRHEIALREQGEDKPYLVFPSEAVRENPDLTHLEGKSVIFDFEGPIQNIYTTLAVRLSHSGLFKKKELWKDAVTYSARVGGLCGIALRIIEDGRGELTLFFDAAASEETRFQFEEYVKTHLERRALPDTIHRQRIFQCPNCKELYTHSQVVRRRQRGFTWLDCIVCGTRFSLLDGAERLVVAHSSLASEEDRAERIVEMDRAADSGVKREVDLLTVQGKEATEDFDVFLCHNDVDKSAVKKIGEQLRQQGILPWLDEWQLRPGLPWQRLLEQQITKIKSAAVFIGKDGVGPWEQLELEAFLREFVKRGCPVIPVILADALQEPQLPIFLQGMTWVDFRRQDPDPLERLIWGITGKRVLPA
jgi:small GTP-binding protein